MRRPRLSFIQSVVATLASLATIAGVVFTILVTVGPLEVGGGSGSGGDSEERPVSALQFGAFQVSSINYCVLKPAQVEESAARLDLGPVIAGDGEYYPGIPVDVVEDGRRWQSPPLEMHEDRWEWSEGQGFYLYDDAWVPLDLKTEDLGRPHDFTVRVDPDNRIGAFGESTNEITVRVNVLASEPSEPRSLPCDVVNGPHLP